MKSDNLSIKLNNCLNKKTCSIDEVNSAVKHDDN